MEPQGERTMLDFVDLHTHTIASGHAYNTRNEMVAAAEAKGLKVFAVTEHAPAMPGSCHEMYFMNYRVLPRTYKDMAVLYGVELNILDYAGTVDLPDYLLMEMDVVLASIHTPCYTSGTVKENTDAYLGAMKNPYINIIAHPDDARFPIDYETFVKAARDCHKILEVNNASLSPMSFRQNAEEAYKEMLQLCNIYRVPVLMDSDAHVDVLVGDHTYAMRLLEQEGFPEELIINANPRMLEDYLNWKGR